MSVSRLPVRVSSFRFGDRVMIEQDEFYEGCYGQVFQESQLDDGGLIYHVRIDQNLVPGEHACWFDPHQLTKV